MTRQLFALGIGAFAVLKEELHGVRLLHSEIQALCAGNRAQAASKELTCSLLDAAGIDRSLYRLGDGAAYLTAYGFSLLRFFYFNVPSVVAEERSTLRSTAQDCAVAIFGSSYRSPSSYSTSPVSPPMQLPPLHSHPLPPRPMSPARARPPPTILPTPPPRSPRTSPSFSPYSSLRTRKTEDSDSSSASCSSASISPAPPLRSSVSASLPPPPSRSISMELPKGSHIVSHNIIASISRRASVRALIAVHGFILPLPCPARTLQSVLPQLSVTSPSLSSSLSDLQQSPQQRLEEYLERVVLSNCRSPTCHSVAPLELEEPEPEPFLPEQDQELLKLHNIPHEFIRSLSVVFASRNSVSLLDEESTRRFVDAANQVVRREISNLEDRARDSNPSATISALVVWRTLQALQRLLSYDELSPASWIAKTNILRSSALLERVIALIAGADDLRLLFGDGPFRGRLEALALHILLSFTSQFGYLWPLVGLLDSKLSRLQDIQYYREEDIIVPLRLSLLLINISSAHKVIAFLQKKKEKHPPPVRVLSSTICSLLECDDSRLHLRGVRLLRNFAPLLLPSLRASSPALLPTLLKFVRYRGSDYAHDVGAALIHIQTLPAKKNKTLLEAVDAGAIGVFTAAMLKPDKDMKEKCALILAAICNKRISSESKQFRSRVDALLRLAGEEIVTLFKALVRQTTRQNLDRLVIHLYSLQCSQVEKMKNAAGLSAAPVLERRWGILSGNCNK